VSKKAKKIRCSCGTKLRPDKDMRCPNPACGVRVTKASMTANMKKAIAAKGGPAFIAKRAAASRPGLPLSVDQALADLYYSPDPGHREIWQQRFGGTS
jgi:hypothetical protein